MDYPLPALVAIPALFMTLLYGLYTWLLPKPIAGIAYNPEATRSLFGDAGSMLREVRATGEFRVWCAKQVRKLNAPLCQVFIRPFGAPWILLADFREARDILTRRREEFDKSSFLSDGMACMGAFHGIYPTGAKFRSNRQLIQDLMTTGFLHGHVAPAVYRKGLEALTLWRMKSELAEGRAFSVKRDFEYVSLDVMVEFAMGDNWQMTALGPQIELLKGLQKAEGGRVEGSCLFPTVPLAKFLNSVYEAPEVVEKTINALMPRLQTWWWSKQSWYRRIFDEKDRVLKTQVAIAVRNYHAGHVRTGLEHMVAREAARAEKDGRQPDFDSSIIRDEVSLQPYPCRGNSKEDSHSPRRSSATWSEAITPPAAP